MDREIKTGMVITVYPSRGYGFIKSAEEDVDLFFHSTALINRKMEEIRVGDMAKFFTLDTTRNGIQAAHVEITK